MAPPDDVALMARMLKLLADRGRLSIIGLLAARPHTLDDLAQQLSQTSRATLTRNLKLLLDAEWISQEEETYQLRTDALTTLRAAVARVEVPPSMEAAKVPAAGPTETSNAVIHAFFDDQGRLRRLPAQRQQREVVLRQVAERLFTLGRIYDEPEVNDLLQPVYPDYPNLRRALIAEGLLESRNGRFWLSVRK